MLVKPETERRRAEKKNLQLKEEEEHLATEIEEVKAFVANGKYANDPIDLTQEDDEDTEEDADDEDEDEN